MGKILCDIVPLKPFWESEWNSAKNIFLDKYCRDKNIVGLDPNPQFTNAKHGS